MKNENDLSMTSEIQQKFLDFVKEQHNVNITDDFLDKFRISI